MANNQQLLLGEGAGGGIPNYIEEVFSTYLYTGTGAAETITNGIDLSTKGGLAWVKSRSNTSNNILNWNASGGSSTDYAISSDTWGGSSGITDFLSTGFTVSTGYGTDGITLGRTYCTWTFRQQPKFFDIVTYTGTGSSTTIAHNLGSVPGCIIVKRVNVAGDWAVYHRSLANTEYLVLNTAAAKATGATWWNSTTPTSSVFSIGTDASVNASGGTYVAYLFAHNAGGFGLAGTDNVISCGSYTGNGSATGPEVTLGYEPQWVMVKQSSASGQWWNMIDVMRGFNVSTGAQTLGANASDAEYTNAGFGSGTPIMSPTATGFQVRSAQSATNASGATYIYIAIRRGPMKVPTVGTSVFSPVAYTGTGADSTTTTGFVTDLAIIKSRGIYSPSFEDRLRGANRVLESSGTGAEITTTQYVLGFDAQTGVRIGTDAGVNGSGTTYVNWAFKRAPGFFDEVCYTGTGSATTVTHNLGVVPELVITKARSSGHWQLYVASLGNTYTISLNGNYAAWVDTSIWNSTNPTAFVFSVNSNSYNNNTGYTYVAYLFATCAGVSKVGSYTGTAAAQVINCGFTAGARFVLIKKTSGTGSWYVWDSSRGIVAGNDPYLLLNSTAAEVTSTDYVDTASVGFEISSTAPSEINENGGSFIFLAIA